jgi:AbrB family looped-hinge helix DNA binding protein
MNTSTQTYHLKIDAAGRVVLPAETRERYHIAAGDTLVMVEDGQGLHIKTRGQLIVEAQAYFARLAPPGVLLSEEILNDRRSDAERD